MIIIINFFDTHCIAFLCAKIINFDAVHCSECHSKEAMFLLMLGVVKMKAVIQVLLVKGLINKSSA